MGKRLTRITTRTGDDGTTGLGDGSRVEKDHPRVSVLGDIDELNSVIGVLLAEMLDEDLRDRLVEVQQHLFELGGEICIPGRTAVALEHVQFVDGAVDELNRLLPPLQEFILPSGNRAGALAHLCRSVCRRAERSLVALGRNETVNPLALQYLNRLSDFFFVLSRSINRRDGIAEAYWRSRRLEKQSAR